MLVFEFDGVPWSVNECWESVCDGADEDVSGEDADKRHKWLEPAIKGEKEPLEEEEEEEREEGNEIRESPQHPRQKQSPTTEGSDPNFQLEYYSCN